MSESPPDELDELRLNELKLTHDSLKHVGTLASATLVILFAVGGLSDGRIEVEHPSALFLAFGLCFASLVLSLKGMEDVHDAIDDMYPEDEERAEEAKVSRETFWRIMLYPKNRSEGKVDREVASRRLAYGCYIISLALLYYSTFS